MRVPAQARPSVCGLRALASRLSPHKPLIGREKEARICAFVPRPCAMHASTHIFITTAHLVNRRNSNEHMWNDVFSHSLTVWHGDC